MMAGRWTHGMFFLLTAMQVGRGLKWKPEPENGSHVYKCVTQNVTLPWDFELENGETLMAVSWTQQRGDRKPINIGDYFAEKFTPKLPGLEKVGTAGIKLSNLSVEDSGTYVVHVALDGKPPLTRSVSLRVSEPPHLLMKDNIEIDQSTSDTAASNQSANGGLGPLQLRCGPFAFRGVPPISVVWEKPGGMQEESYNYDGKYFWLDLGTTFAGGEYYCQINNSSPAFQCLEDDSRLRERAARNILALRTETVQAAGLAGGEVAAIGVSIAAILLIIIIIVAFLLVKSKRGKYYKPRKSEDEPGEGAMDPLKKVEVRQD